MLNRVGIDYLAELLQSPRYRLYDFEKNGGIWVGKEYGKAPAQRRDPLHNLSHGATALQVARFYYLLETGQLVSPDLSKLLRAVQPDSEIYRKSGTWGPYHSDSAIIEHHGRRYIAVALAKSRQGEQWLQKLIVALDSIICPVEMHSN
jgi:beta-lactamase class A